MPLILLPPSSHIILKFHLVFYGGLDVWLILRVPFLYILCHPVHLALFNSYNMTLLLSHKDCLYYEVLFYLFKSFLGMKVSRGMVTSYSCLNDFLLSFFINLLYTCLMILPRMPQLCVSCLPFPVDLLFLYRGIIGSFGCAVFSLLSYWLTFLCFLLWFPSYTTALCNNFPGFDC